MSWRIKFIVLSRDSYFISASQSLKPSTMYQLGKNKNAANFKSNHQIKDCGVERNKLKIESKL